jgi:hypothetical protein
VTVSLPYLIPPNIALKPSQVYGLLHLIVTGSEDAQRGSLEIRVAQKGLLGLSLTSARENSRGIELGTKGTGKGEQEGSLSLR